MVRYLGSTDWPKPIFSELSAGYYHQVNFDASIYNPIYGASETVQPPAFEVDFFIKARYDHIDVN